MKEFFEKELAGSLNPSKFPNSNTKMNAAPQDARPLKIREILARLEKFRSEARYAAENAIGDFKAHTMDSHIRDAESLGLAISILDNVATGAIHTLNPPCLSDPPISIEVEESTPEKVKEYLRRAGVANPERYIPDGVQRSFE